MWRADGNAMRVVLRMVVIFLAGFAGGCGAQSKSAPAAIPPAAELPAAERRANWDGHAYYYSLAEFVRDVDAVISLDQLKVDQAGMLTARVAKVIKGKMKGKELRVDLTGSFQPQQVAFSKELFARAPHRAPFFILPPGAHIEEETADQAPEKETFGILTVGDHSWLQTIENKDGTWDAGQQLDQLAHIWEGGLDMMFQAVDYIMAHPEKAEFPFQEAMQVDSAIQVGTLEGKIDATVAVDVSGTGKLDLFVAAEKGDRLYQWNGETFDDITAASGLTGRSRAFVWGDFNGDGRLDLASYDGRELTIFSQDSHGHFTARAVGPGDALTNGCLALTTFDDGKHRGRPVILVSTRASPVALTIQPDGAARARPLIQGEFPGDALGQTGECVVADFDNDGLPDILQIGAKASLFYKGTSPGQFAAPVLIPVAAGPEPGAACIGDLDADGLLDLFTCSADQCHLWSNTGSKSMAHRFEDTVEHSAELDFVSSWGGNSVQIADFNNDGRQGLFLANPDGRPMLFFNRGFRTLMECYMLLSEQIKQGVPQAEDGQQAGCFGDFTGIGADSLVLALKGGEIWLFPRHTDDHPHGLTVSLSLKSRDAGPVTVWAQSPSRAFGAAVIRAGDPGMIYGLDVDGPVTVKWRFPGHGVREKVVKIGKGPGGMRIVIDRVDSRDAKGR